MPSSTYNVLFLCTGNSARSVMSEDLLNLLGHGRFRAFSAGKQPSGRVNPFAIELLAEAGCDVEGLRSKSWDEFAAADAPQMDMVITVCGNAANETCPVWPDAPLRAHWGYEAPGTEGDEAAGRASFKLAGSLETRLATGYLNAAQ